VGACGTGLQDIDSFYPASLKELELMLSTKGYRNLFKRLSLKILFQPVHEHSQHVVYRRSFRRIGTPESISQMYSLSKVSGTGFIVTFREDFEKWHDRLLTTKLRVFYADRTKIESELIEEERFPQRKMKIRHVY
jgi:hypothetical protein